MEAIGAASAILAIATAGVQCSVKLMTFAGQVKTAPEQINMVAEEVSLNASILQQLGELAKENVETKHLTSDDKDNGQKYQGEIGSYEIKTEYLQGSRAGNGDASSEKVQRGIRVPRRVFTHSQQTAPCETPDIGQSQAQSRGKVQMAVSTPGD
ncbi:Glucose-methanol-choline oxidoreductase N-terminal [Penicillium concentricum]|uniref:Glucose-methanol-choline oxidoreductase N-terminal n=1 Tax=Penicillium concentricum TaxID=293559 RepID=A0A9W9S552_9EURO|nr:Glucose-methanol-choline oxidoreductase N-terminal [Penicillium concentricum]KAJ5371550.1 Glucose-methanol-choline oxidoreductase N-terminal [Penicillium concentricum]